MRFLLSIAMVLTAAWTAGAQGTTQPAIRDYTNAIIGSFNDTAGWSFRPATNITVTQLGCLANFFPGNPSITLLQVGLWDSNGLLLASNSITAGSTLLDRSRYESVVAQPLIAGQTYRIGAYAPGAVFSLDAVFPGVGGSVTPSLDILSLASAEGTGGFASPIGGSTPISGAAFLGPNFRYTGGGAGVPEPSSCLLLGLGGLLLTASRRTRRL